MGGSLSLQGNSGEVTIVGNIQSNSQSQSTSQISIQSNSGEVIIGGNRLNTQSSHPGQMSIQGDSGPVVISGNQVNDQFTYSGNSAPPPSTANVSQPVSQVSGNVFDESANFVGNRGGGRILNNQVAGSLNCVGNQPNFQASGNSAQVNNCGQGQPPPG
jgi:hypothetical protein